MLIFVSAITMISLRFLLFHPFSGEPLFRTLTKSYDPYRYVEELRYNQGTELLEKLPQFEKGVRLIVGGSHAERLILPEFLKNDDFYYLQMSYFGIYQLLGLLNVNGSENLKEIIYVHLPLDFIPVGWAQKTEFLPLPLEGVFETYLSAREHPIMRRESTKLLWKWLFRSLFVEYQAFGMYEAIHNHLYDQHEKIFLRKHIKFYNKEFRGLQMKGQKSRLVSKDRSAGLEEPDLRGSKELANKLWVIDWQLSTFERFLTKLKKTNTKLTVVISRIKRSCESPHFEKIKKYSEEKIKALHEQYQFNLLTTSEEDRVSDDLFLDCEHFKPGVSDQLKNLPLNLYLNELMGAKE